MKELFKKLNSEWLHISFFVVSMAIIFLLFLHGLEWITFHKATEEQIVIDTSTVKEIENVTINGKYLELSGWAIRINSINEEIRLALRPIDESKAYLLKTVCEIDETINNFFSEDWKYGKVRFQTEIERNKLKENVCYEIVLVLTYEAALDSYKEYTRNIETGKYLYNEQLYSYNPQEFIKPVFEDELMKKVVEEGELCLYDAQETVYVYRYEEKFYWIVGSQFKFNSNNNAYIIYHVGTSQPEKLPEHRQIHKFENLDFYFADKEYVLEEKSDYRIAIREVPTGYPITYFYTGIYNTETKNSIWDSYIYPSYNLK